MRRAVLLVAAVALMGVAATAQDVPPPPIVPCGLGQPDYVPCYDTMTGKVIHTGSQMALPHQNLTNPLPSGNDTGGKVTVPSIQAPSVTPPAPLAHVPYWTFKGDAAYYHDGAETKSVGIESLQSMIQAPNPPQDFASGEAIGAVAGGIVGGLISRWLAHRRRLKLERKNFKQQIIAYYDATYRLDQDQREALGSIVANEIALSRIDPARRGLYLRAEKGSAPWKASLARLDSMLAKSRPVILAAKDTGFLRHMLVQAREFYDLELEYAKKLYAFSQLSELLSDCGDAEPRLAETLHFASVNGNRFAPDMHAPFFRRRHPTLDTGANDFPFVFSEGRDELKHEPARGGIEIEGFAVAD